MIFGNFFENHHPDGSNTTEDKTSQMHIPCLVEAKYIGAGNAQSEAIFNVT
jgi:hypothetical protein